jgi:hypothetical protein
VRAAIKVQYSDVQKSQHRRHALEQGMANLKGTGGMLHIGGGEDPIPADPETLQRELEKKKKTEAEAFSLLSKLKHWPVKFYNLGMLYNYFIMDWT